MKRLAPSLLGTLAPLLLLAGCSTIDAAGRFAEDVVVLQEGRRIALAAYDATLMFVEKTEDSRCPANVVCIWEGQVKILLEFARGSQAPASFEMVGFVGPGGKADAGEARVTHEAFGLRFTLVRLDPYPVDGVEQPDPVTATIQVEAL